MVETDRQIGDLPPSAKLVFKVLEYNRGLTQKQLVKETRLSQRTARDALSRLMDRDIVEKNIYLPDARQNAYRISMATGSEATEASNA